MRQKDYEMQHRNYYLDHPTSLNHKQPYITSLQNQYSILNHSRNPYQVLDHYNYQLRVKEKQPLIYSVMNQTSKDNQSLTREAREWSRRQYQKQNSHRSLKEQINGLTNVVKTKEAQTQLQKLRLQLRNQSNKSPGMPYPMLIPFGSLGFQMPINNGCNCFCSCACRGQPVSCRRSTPVKRYRPLITENSEMQPYSSGKLPLIQSKIKSPQPITQHSLSSVRSAPKIQSKPQHKQAMRLQKKKKSNLLRRFRICAYAVYFCIYFKWFSFQFSINRYNRFKNKYLIDTGIQITDSYRQVYQKILGIDIPELIRTAAKNVTMDKKNADFDISTLIKQESIQKLNIISNYKILTKNQEILFLRCAQFLTLMFQQLQSVFQSWQWDDKMGEALGVGALNNTFLIDNYFLPHQIYLMVIHKGKGYARITREHERSQVMVKFIAKILLFNVCLQLDNNRQWLQEHQKQLEEQGDQGQIFVLLQISSKILFIIIQFLYQEVLGDIQPNYDEVSQQFKISPCNLLVYSHSIRRRRQLFKEQNIKESNLLIYGIQNLDQVNKIMKQEFFNNSNAKITNAVNGFVQLILDKLKTKNKQVYSQLWEETLNNEYIVLRGIKRIMKSSRFFSFDRETEMNSQNANKKTGLAERQQASKESLKKRRNNKNNRFNLQNSKQTSKATIKQPKPYSSSNIVAINNMLSYK